MTNQDIQTILEQRIGLYARQRLEIEKVFGQGIRFFPIENLALSSVLIRAVLMATGLYWRGIRNAAKVAIRHNRIDLPHLPKAFDGFTIVQLSDLHVEMSEGAMERAIDLLAEARYDVCILTGDYRGGTCGPYDTTLAGMAGVRDALKGPIYGVLGDHDTIGMVPGLEAMGIKVLLNESVLYRARRSAPLSRRHQRCPFIRSGQHREGCCRDPSRRVFHPDLAHAGSVSAGRRCRLQCSAERPYPWRPDLPTGRYPNHA